MGINKNVLVFNSLDSSNFVLSQNNLLTPNLKLTFSCFYIKMSKQQQNVAYNLFFSLFIDIHFNFS